MLPPWSTAISATRLPMIRYGTGVRRNGTMKSRCGGAEVPNPMVAAVPGSPVTSDLSRDLAGEGEHDPHRFVTTVRHRLEHKRASAVDHLDPVVPPPGRCLG